MKLWKIDEIMFRCGNKFDQKNKIQISDSDMEAFCEQCHNLVSGNLFYVSDVQTLFIFSGIYKTSCKTGEGVEEMFMDIAKQLAHSNRSRMELQTIEENSFHVSRGNTNVPRDLAPGTSGDGCSC